MIRKEKKSEWVLKFGVFRNALGKHFTETKHAKEYARMMNIFYKHLNEICKSITGSTAKAFIDNFIILEMKRRLAISVDSVKELTYQLGFDGPTEAIDLDKTEANKTLVAGFIEDVLKGANPGKIAEYISTETYHQHNPAVADGLDALGKALEVMANAGMPMVYTEIVRSHLLKNCKMSVSVPYSLFVTTF